MSRKSPLVVGSKSKFPYSATVTDTSFYNEPSNELKVCGDCHARQSHKGMSQSDYGVRKYQNQEDRDDLHYMSMLPQETLETSKRKNTNRNDEEIDVEKFNEEHSFNKSGYSNKNEFPSRGVDKENSKLSKSNRLFVGEGSMKRANDTMTSFNDSMPKSFNDSHYKKEQYRKREEEEGEDRFIRYTEDFAADLDKATFRLESDLKRKFETTAHSLLHQHVNNKSLLENDETYRNREIRTQNFTEDGNRSFSQKRSFPTAGDYYETTNIDPSFISDSYPRKNDQSSPLGKRSEFAATLPTNGDKWKNSTTNDFLSNTFPNPSLSPIPTSVPAKESADSLASPPSKLKSSTLDRKNRHVSYGGEDQDAVKEETVESDRDQIGINYEGNPEEGVNLRKVNERLKAQVKPVADQDRFFLSPPNSQLNRSGGILKNKFASSYETSPDYKFMNEFQESIRSKGEMNSSAKVRIVDYESPEEQVGKLEEIALGLIKETRFEEALECLTEAERIVRHEIPSTHPQHLYIYYLLGECHIKQGDYYRAESILDQAISRYEEKSVEDEISSQFAYYYLGLLVLASHVAMSHKSFHKALDLYRKLIIGTDLYDKTQDKKTLKGIIPNILLIKYNMGECYRSLQKLDESDDIFHEFVSFFDFKDDELLQNYPLLLTIAEYFIDRQRQELALEALKKVCEAGVYSDNIEKSDPELFMSIYDEIATILFNRGGYAESTKYYELSFKIKVKRFGMKQLKVGYSLLALGKAYHMGGENIKALQRLASGLEVIESIEGRTTYYSANISLTMAKIHFLLQEFGRAIYLYERSLDIYSHLLGFGHPYCFRVYANLVYVCFACNDLKKATQIAERMTKAASEAQHPEIFGVLNEIGNIYRKNSFPVEALSFYTLAIKKYSEIDHSQIPLESVYLVYVNMGSASYYQRKYGDALQYYKEAAKYFTDLAGGVNPQIVLIYINVVRVYKALGKHGEANMYLKKAMGILKVLEKENGGDDQEVVRLKNDLKILKSH